MAVDRFSYLLCFLFRRRQQKIRMANNAKAATPPSTPPIIAPRFEDAALGMLVGVLDGEAVADSTGDNAVIPVATEEVSVSS